MLRRWFWSLLCLAACASTSSSTQDAAELTIIDEDAKSPTVAADTTPPELMAPSTDPATTCLRVAERLARCNNRHTAAVVHDLPAPERAEAEAAIADASAAIAKMREQCGAPMKEAERQYVQAMGRCLSLGCTALRECVSRAP